MIITDITVIDNIAERMFGNNPKLVTLDMGDYNTIKCSSSYLNAVTIDLPFHIEAGIGQFEQAIKTLNKDGAHLMLLQINGVSNGLEVRNIKLNEMHALLDVVRSHFGNISIIWGLSDCRSDDRSDYEAVVIVGYK